MASVQLQICKNDSIKQYDCKWVLLKTGIEPVGTPLLEGSPGKPASLSMTWSGLSTMLRALPSQRGHPNSGWWRRRRCTALVM